MQRASGVARDSIDTIVDEVIARAYAAVDAGLEINDFARTEHTLDRLSAIVGHDVSEPRPPYVRPGDIRSEKCRLCGKVNTWRRIGRGNTVTPPTQCIAHPRTQGRAPTRWQQVA